jgi:nitrite reductase (NADH) small subunit
MSIVLPPNKVIYNLGPLARIPQGEGRTFQVEEAAIAIFHTRNGKVFAVQATCPHKNGPLADGIVGDDKVVCPLHAYKFDLASGEALGNACETLKTYTVTVNEQGDLLLTVD